MARAMERSAARLAAVQALYQMDVTGKTLPDIFAEFETYWIGGEIEGEQYNKAELAFFRDILKGVLDDQGRLTAPSTRRSSPPGRSPASNSVMRADAARRRLRAEEAQGHSRPASSSRNMSTSQAPFSARRRAA